MKLEYCLNFAYCFGDVVDMFGLIGKKFVFGGIVVGVVLVVSGFGLGLLVGSVKVYGIVGNV